MKQKGGESWVRGFGAGVSIALAVSFLIRFAHAGYYLYLFKAGVCLALAAIFVLRSRALRLDASAAGLLAPLAHMSIPLGFSRGDGALVPEIAAIALALSGLLISALSFVDLWEYFGILPAYRGIRTSGAYRLVRHPIYLGYLVAGLGWVLLSFSWRNLAVFGTYFGITLYRVGLEEKLLLASDPGYQAYSSQVRFRLIPWVI